MNWSNRLRKELSNRAVRYAELKKSPHYFSSSGSTVLFERAPDGKSHGNFNPATFTEIMKRPSWSARLTKPHSQRPKLPKEKARSAMELDSCNSSDALLMNICCHPNSGLLAPLFGEVESVWEPEFGVPGRVPLLENNTDSTELDMVVGSSICEAKLTEADFTKKPLDDVLRYRDVETAFDLSHLVEKDNVVGYQLIRNVLSAHEYSMRFIVLCDSRRPDLIQEWWRVHSAIRITDLRYRCRLVTWQEIAVVASTDLKSFLFQKYGINDHSVS